MGKNNVLPEIKVMAPTVVNKDGVFSDEDWEYVMRINPELKREWAELQALDANMGFELRVDVDKRIREILAKR